MLRDYILLYKFVTHVSTISDLPIPEVGDIRSWNGNVLAPSANKQTGEFFCIYVYNA